MEVGSNNVDRELEKAIKTTDCVIIGTPTDEQMKKLMLIQSINAANYMRTIKSCVVFVTALIALSVFVSVILPLLM